MNEDYLLAGKIYYSLSYIGHDPIVVGRQNLVPKPEIVLRGPGIQ